MTTRPAKRSSGFGTFGCLGHLVAIGLFLLGCHGVYVALKNHEPLEVTVERYISKKPDGEWVTLTEAHLSLSEAAAYKLKMGDISEIYIPVRPVGQSTSEPIHILLSTQDPAALADMQRLSQAHGSIQDKITAVSQQEHSLFAQRQVTGLIRNGLFFDRWMMTRLANLKMNLAADFVIFREGAVPDLGMSLGMLGAALLIWFVMFCLSVSNAIGRWRRRRAFYRR